MAIRPIKGVNLDEFVQLPAGVIAANLNPEFWIARQNDILGGFHQYDTLEDFIALHPNKMEVGMKVTINEHTRTGGVFLSTDFKLQTLPTVADFPLSLVETDPNYYLNYWIIKDVEAIEATTYEIEYAPDIRGLKPQYPYIANEITNPGDDALWTDSYVAGVSKWYRERRSDEVDVGTGIYKYWTAPRSINGNFESGDYVQNLFIRAAAPPTLPAAEVDGLPNNEPAGWTDVPPAGIDPLYEIRAQKDQYGNLKTAWIGPFLIPEDEDLVRYNSKSSPHPDTLASVTEDASTGLGPDLDLIAAGWVKTFNPAIHNYRAIRVQNGVNDYDPWNIDKIAEESGEYIDRIYKLFSINTDFDDATFQTNNTPTGNDPIANTESASENIGWFDTPQPETDSLINGESQARKFFDGSLKTTWSPPRAATGQSVYAEFIKSDGQNVFKYANSDDLANDIATPTTITLTAELYKGNNEVTTGLTYAWHKVYNNKAIIAEGVPIATTQAIVVTPADVATKAIYKCYITLANEGAEADIVFSEEEFIVDITDGDDAKSLTLAADAPTLVYNTVGPAGSITAFADAGGGQVTVTSAAHGLKNGYIVTISGTTNYNGTFTISNVTTNTFEITDTWVADDATGSFTSTGFPVTTIYIRGRQNFLDGVTFYWYKDNGAGTWIDISADVNYTLTNQTLQIDSVDLFTSDGTAQTARFALTTAALPANVEGVSEFYDIVTITKLASTSTGAAGIDASSIILSNEVDSVILDRATLLPQAGEIGASGRIKTLIKIYDGPTKLDYPADYTITRVGGTAATATLNPTDTTDVTWGHQTVGTDLELYIDAWTSTVARKINIPFEIDITGGSQNLAKNFTVSSNLDDAGALIAFVRVDATSVNPSFSFTPGDRNDIKLEAVLDQNGDAIAAANFDGNVVWKYDTVTTATNLSGTNNINKTVKRIDVTNSLSVTAEITFNGQTYKTVPVTIDDITDAFTYRLHYNYAAAYDIEANEPLVTPTKPADLATSAFAGTFLDSGATTDWYKQSGTKTYFIVEGTVAIIAGVDTIQWQTPYRTRSEKGDQGDSPDFIVFYYKGDNTLTPPSIAPSNASRDTMIANGWLPTPNGIVEAYTYQASTTFNGSDLAITSALATNNWGVNRITPINGNTIERRYQGSATNSFATFVNTERDAGTAWTTVRPASNAFNYIFETTVYIDPTDTIVGTWSTPVLIYDNTVTGSDTEVLLNSSGIIGTDPNLKFDGTTLLIPSIETDNNLTQVVVFDVATGKFKVMDMTALAANQKSALLIKTNQTEREIQNKLNKVFLLDGFDSSVDNSGTDITISTANGTFTTSLKGKYILTLNGVYKEDDLTKDIDAGLKLVAYFLVDGDVVDRQEVDVSPRYISGAIFYDLDIVSKDLYLIEGAANIIGVELVLEGNTQTEIEMEVPVGDTLNFGIYFENAIA